ncbi:unnamed protein product [Penicillium salamii]|uniref:Uncharacterized protein n=1 Tax=Penicillium salamii TaxID=1612424 RepID=A0A9W4K3Z9_9EURO|nr:unnamed protein product [Penicillium salamii]
MAFLDPNIFQPEERVTLLTVKVTTDEQDQALFSFGQASEKIIERMVLDKTSITMRVLSVDIDVNGQRNSPTKPGNRPPPSCPERPTVV